MPLKNIKVEKDELVFDETTRISFERTLRIPDDGKIYPLPPSFGHFPICKVDDYIEKVPESWKKTGGVFIPMWQREAMWVQFTAAKHLPRAVKVAIGKVNAVSGKPWDQKISSETDDYVVIPEQPWLDGINSGEGQIKQFVAMELGKGYTVEAQVTGKEEFGGIQLIVYDPKPGKIKPAPAPVVRSKPSPFSFYKKKEAYYGDEDLEDSASSALDSLEMEVAELNECMADISSMAQTQCEEISSVKAKKSVNASSCRRLESKESRKSSAAKEMGLAAGGKMSQKIYKDPYGSDCWDENNYQRIYVRIVNSAMYEQITGKQPPQTPIDASAYTNFGYPWFNQYDENAQSVASSSVLQNVKSVKEIDQQKYAWPQQDDSTVNISGSQVISFKKADPGAVRDGDW